jgi:pyocin large subunit-like protein
LAKSREKKGDGGKGWQPNQPLSENPTKNGEDEENKGKTSA